MRSCEVQKRDIWEFRRKEERAGILPFSAARGCGYCQPEKGNPRTLRELDRWKATEFRMFLLYTGSVILSSYLDTNIYNNFMLLFSAIAILFSPTLSSLHLQYAEILLQMFVTHFGQVYGKDALVYNVHSLVHLAQDVRLHGCLDNFSPFPYENYLQMLKKLVRQPECPLAQIIRCLSEKTTYQTKQMATSLKKPHFVGPVPNELAIKGVPVDNQSFNRGQCVYPSRYLFDCKYR